MKSLFTSMAAALAAISMGAFAASAQTPAPPGSRTLEQVKARGVLVCGSNPGLAGFGMPDDKGVWTGLDVDLCRAVAAAIFNDPTKVRFVPLTAKDRFTALQSGEVDVLSRNGTWTHFARGRTRAPVGRRQLLRRPGLHGPQEAQRQLGAGTVRRLGLRAAGHDDGNEPRRLLPLQQHEVRAGRLRHLGRGGEAVRRRAVATPTRRTCRASMPSVCVSSIRTST